MAKAKSRISTKHQTPDSKLWSLRFAYWNLFVICNLSFGISSFAQQTKISGRVLDATTKEPLPFVSIGFKNSKVVTSSDFDGTFSISSDVPSDSLIFSYVGYLRLAKSVKKGLVYVQNVELKTNETLLNEVVILHG